MTRHRRPDFLRHLRFRGHVPRDPAPDPDRRKRALPPTASLEEHIEDFVGWMIAGGIEADYARGAGEWVREYQRQTGKNFLSLPPEEQLAVIAEFDRQLDELERQASKGPR